MSNTFKQDILAPTRLPGDSTNAVASTAFVTAAISAAVSPSLIGLELNIAALRAATSITLAQSVCFVEGYYTKVDGGEGIFEYISTDTTSADNGGTIIVDASSRRWYRTNDSRPVTIKQFGAYGDNTHDDTVAIQAAITLGGPVYIPPGQYLISSQINISTFGQVIQGAGKLLSFINITGPNAGFVAGIFNLTITSGDACMVFKDFCVACTQPDTSVRGSLNTYPPIFYLNTTPRVQFERVRIVGGLDGIHMNANCGGFRATACDFGNFLHNIYIDGNQDITTFTDCEVWPFSATGIMTVNQQSIFGDTSAVGVFSLRDDYFLWENGLFLIGRAALFGLGLTGPTYGGFTNTGFDTYGGLEVSAGQISATNCVFSVAGGSLFDKNAVLHTGGVVIIEGGQFYVGSLQALNGALIYSDVPSGSAALVVSNSYFQMGAIDNRAIYIAPETNQSLTVNIIGNRFDRQGTGAYTTNIIELNAGTGSVIGNSCSQYLSATGGLDFLSVGSQVGPYSVTGNNNNGWSYTVTGTAVASASIITIPPVFGQAMPFVNITGTTTIGGMTAYHTGVTAPYAGSIVTLLFASALTVNSGTYGTAGQFILNGRTNFTVAADSTLTVQLNAVGNWQEIGRCA